MNKQTIQQVDAAIDRWLSKATRAINMVYKLRAKRKRMINGKIKTAPPPSVKVKIMPGKNVILDDDIPAFLDRRPQV